MPKCPQCSAELIFAEEICPGCGFNVGRTDPALRRPLPPPACGAGHPEERLGNRLFPILAAGGLGLFLGCGSGFLLPAVMHGLLGIDFGIDLLFGSVAGALTGLVAGLDVGIAQSRARQTNLHLAVTRGLLAAGTCVITLAVVFLGRLSGFHPVIHDAGSAALLLVVFLGLPIAALGSVVGAVVAVLMRNS